jgi:hypothetical protein
VRARRIRRTPCANFPFLSLRVWPVVPSVRVCSENQTKKCEFFGVRNPHFSYWESKHFRSKFITHGKIIRKCIQSRNEVEILSYTTHPNQMFWPIYVR